MGRSGCGKSTLTRLLVGLISPSCGEIRWCGTSLTKLKGKAISQFRKDVQIVFQDPITAVNPRKTIDEIIREPIRHLLSLTKKEQHARITKMLNAVELDSFLLNQRPPQLSGGQLQRVCLARAMVVEPKLLILDEAVSNLDLILSGRARELPPCAPTEPDVTVSRHPALVVDHSRRVQISQCANRQGLALCILLNHSYA